MSGLSVILTELATREAEHRKLREHMVVTYRRGMVQHSTYTPPQYRINFGTYTMYYTTNNSTCSCDTVGLLRWGSNITVYTTAI